MIFSIFLIKGLLIFVYKKYMKETNDKDCSRSPETADCKMQTGDETTLEPLY